ncbi:hypothetical protein [Agromyces sp. NPDC055661]
MDQLVMRDAKRTLGWWVIGVAISIVAMVFVSGIVYVGLWAHYRSQPVLVEHMVGTWVLDSSGGGGTLTLESDGTAVAERFSYPSRGQRITGTGVWLLSDSGWRGLTVRLDATDSQEEGPIFLPFDIDRTPHGIDLLTYVGDPDDPRNVRVFVQH